MPRQLDLDAVSWSDGQRLLDLFRGPPPGATMTSHKAYLPFVSSPVARKRDTSPTTATVRPSPGFLMVAGVTFVSLTSSRSSDQQLHLSSFPPGFERWPLRASCGAALRRYVGVLRRVAGAVTGVRRACQLLPGSRGRCQRCPLGSLGHPASGAGPRRDSAQGPGDRRSPRVQMGQGWKLTTAGQVTPRTSHLLAIPR
jgi:hypothetical protein